MFGWSARAFCALPKRAAAGLVRRLSFVSSGSSNRTPPLAADGKHSSSPHPPSTPSTVELVLNRGFVSKEVEGDLLESAPETESNSQSQSLPPPLSQWPSPLPATERLVEAEVDVEEESNEFENGPSREPDHRVRLAIPSRLVSNRERYESSNTTNSSLLSGVGSYQNLL